MKKLLFLTVSCIVFVQQTALAMYPLHVAVRVGDKDQVAALLNSGMDVNQPDDYGMTPLHYAAYRGNEAVVLLLLEHNKANVNRPDKHGWTPLHFAVQYGSRTVVCLLQHGANVNQPDNAGNTPLHFVQTAGQEAVVRLLLEHGANPNLAGLFDIKPLDYSFVDTIYTEILQQRKHAARLAILMGLQPRVGARSSLCTSKDIVQQIAEYLQPEHFSQTEMLQQRIRTAQLVFCTGLHPRAGACSSVRCISAFNINQIFACLQPEYFLPITSANHGAQNIQAASSAPTIRQEALTLAQNILSDARVQMAVAAIAVLSFDAWCLLHH